MKAKARKSCTNCRRLQAHADAQEARLKALRPLSPVSRRNAAARKDSSTSSKPPSSDIVKPGQA